MSRKIDALVAEHAMNLGKVSWSGDELLGVLRGNDGILDEVPHYSTDITAAMLVVEKLSKEGAYIQITTGPAEKHRVRIQKYTAPESVYITDIEERAATLPMAICLAILKLEGIEVDA